MGRQVSARRIATLPPQLALDLLTLIESFSAISRYMHSSSHIDGD